MELINVSQPFDSRTSLFCCILLFVTRACSITSPATWTTSPTVFGSRKPLYSEARATMSDTVPSSSLISWLFFGSKVVGGLVATLVAILYVNQEKMLYMPNPPGFPKTHMENPPGFQSPGEWSTSGRHCSPGSADAIEYEEHFVTTKDGVRIHTWLMLHKDSEDRPTLIYFHGNAGNMGFRLKNAALMFAKSEINVLMMDYRGYGSSEGTPTELGLMQDAEAVLLYALQHPRLKNSRMVAFGRSLGGAVAISLAQAFPDLVSGVVVENTFLSVSDMVDVVLPILSPIKSLVLFMKWHSYLKIQELSMPTLFISGDQDQLVPPSHMRRLFELARGEKEFYSVAGGTHNDTFEIAGVEYYRRLRQFMRQQVRARTGPEAQAHAMAIAQAQTQAQEEKQPQAQAQAVVGVGVDGEEGYEIIDSDVGPASALPSLPTMDKGFGVK